MSKHTEKIGMVSRVPYSIIKGSIRDLKRSNYFFGLVLGGFSFFFMIIFNVSFQRIVAIFVSSFIYLNLLGFLKLQILIYSARFYHNQIVKFNVFRYGLSWGVAILAQFVTFPIFLLMNKDGIHLELFNIKLLLVFVANGLLMGGLLFLMHDYIIIRNLKREIELENSRLLVRAEEAKTLLLKKQVHPHFFFNSLNTLKALYKKDQQLGESYLLHLADFMRISVSNHTSQVAKLKEELRLCDNYIEMQSIRFGAALKVTKSIADKEKLNWYLPFFSLQPLLENALKHNVLTKENPLIIHIEQKENVVKIANNLNPKKYKESSPKSGLTNLCERYYMWSKDEVMIYEEQDNFIVACKLYPNENPDN